MISVMYFTNLFVIIHIFSYCLSGPELWNIVAMEIGAKRLAIQSTIKPDGMRTPNVKMLLGETGWVTHVDNSIRLFYK